MLEIKNKQTLPGHCCQSTILHLLFLPLMQSANGLGGMFFCSQDRLLTWHENLVRSYLFSNITHYISGCNFYSSSHVLCLLYPSWWSQPVLWTSTLCHSASDPLVASLLFLAAGLALALSVCNQALPLSIYMKPAPPQIPQTIKLNSIQTWWCSQQSWDLPAVVSRQLIQPELCLLFTLFIAIAYQLWCCL